MQHLSAHRFDNDDLAYVGPYSNAILCPIFICMCAVCVQIEVMDMNFYIENKHQRYIKM